MQLGVVQLGGKQLGGCIKEEKRDDNNTKIAYKVSMITLYEETLWQIVNMPLPFFIIEAGAQLWARLFV